MSISLLKTLVAVADSGSFSAAADKVFVSHAAVGQQMKRLEQSLQVTLFDRTSKVPRLNQLGMALVPKAREVIHAYETILDDLTGDPRYFGELTVGAVPSMIRGLVPKSAKLLIKSYPELRIRVVQGLSDDLLEQVERGAVDAAILSKPVRIESHLHWQPFAEEELVLLTASEVKDNDPYRLLREMPYIRHVRRTAVGLLADKWLSDNNITVKSAMDMESLDTLSCMVAHNLGISVVPNVCVPDPVFSQLKKIPLNSNPTCRILGVLTRGDCSKIRLVDRLLDEIEKVVSEYK